MKDINNSTPKRIAKTIGKGLLTGAEFALELLFDVTMSTATKMQSPLNQKTIDLDQEYKDLSHDFSYWTAEGNIRENKEKKENRLNEITDEQNKIMEFQKNYQNVIDNEDEIRDQIKKMKGR